MQHTALNLSSKATVASVAPSPPQTLTPALGMSPPSNSMATPSLGTLFPTQPVYPMIPPFYHPLIGYTGYLQQLCALAELQTHTQRLLSTSLHTPTKPRETLVTPPSTESKTSRPSTPSKLSPRSCATSTSLPSPPKEQLSTVDYTYDALFLSDGRSKRRRPSPAQPPSNQRYSCAQCGKSYATSSNLSRHKQTHRPLDSVYAKKCPECGKAYVSMPALSMHMLTHKREHVCPTCGKAFSRPWLLQGHMRSHTGQKPFGCAHCGKAFADRSNLRAHMQTHSDLKRHMCDRCGKSFSLRSYLSKHIEMGCSATTSMLQAILGDESPPSMLKMESPPSMLKMESPPSMLKMESPPSMLKMEHFES